MIVEYRYEVEMRNDPRFGLVFSTVKAGNRRAPNPDERQKQRAPPSRKKREKNEREGRRIKGSIRTYVLLSTSQVLCTVRRSVCTVHTCTVRPPCPKALRARPAEQQKRILSQSLTDINK
jgi:hypothetical protein